MRRSKKKNPQASGRASAARPFAVKPLLRAMAYGQAMTTAHFKMKFARFCVAAWVATGLLGWCGAAHADLPMPGLPATPGELCRQAIAVAERANAIPPHLLAAIGRVESGRRDPGSGAMHPWPWTINAEGEGHFYDSKAEAISATSALQSHGMRSIDVGCMQVNLMHHPDAFTSLEQAFDPQINAAWAARFLRQLYQQSGDWHRATALYHSATPDLGNAYEARVMAALPDEVRDGSAFIGTTAGLWPHNPIGGTAVTGGAMTINSHLAEPHMIMLPGVGGSPAGGGGRALADYRNMPIALASRGIWRPTR